jgi:diguanylate cyclase (GGDEF)-like protein
VSPPHAPVLRGFLFAIALWGACAQAALPASRNLPDGISAGELQVLEDPSTRATLAEILQRRNDFRDVVRRTPNYQFTSSAFWFRMTVQNRSNRPAALILNVPHPTLDYLSLYVLASGGARQVIQSGDRIPSHARPYPGPSLALPFHLAAAQSAELYLRVQADAAAVLVPIELMSEDALRASMLSERVFHGTLLGVFVALFVYNLFVLVLLRTRTYFYYVAYLPLAYLALSSLDGFGAAVFYRYSTWPGNEGLVVFSGTSFSLILLFTRSFLRTSEHPVLDRYLKLLLGSTVILALSPFVLPRGIAYEIGVSMMFLLPTACICAGIASWRSGKTEARFYVLGQAASWIGLLLFGMLMLDFLPYHFILLEAIPLGLSVDALLLALALGDRIRILQNAKQMAEDAAHRSLETRKEELERTVAYRTAELEAARKQAELLATIDPLTAILNRRGLLERAERDLELAIRSGNPLSAVIFDIDHLKKVNDTYGHSEGDRVLCEVVAAVRKAVRATDLFGRIGGEEFLLVMPNTSSEAAAQIAERMRAAIAQDVGAGPPRTPVTASFGVASVPERGVDLDWLQSAADAALYGAKHNGRNRVVEVAYEMLRVSSPSDRPAILA